MAANRKLMTEIQQVLKKVEEGVEVFDEIWEKVYAGTCQCQCQCQCQDRYRKQCAACARQRHNTA